MNVWKALLYFTHPSSNVAVRSGHIFIRIEHHCSLHTYLIRDDDSVDDDDDDHHHHDHDNGKRKEKEYDAL